MGSTGARWTARGAVGDPPRSLGGRARAIGVMLAVAVGVAVAVGLGRGVGALLSGRAW